MTEKPLYRKQESKFWNKGSEAIGAHQTKSHFFSALSKRIWLRVILANMRKENICFLWTLHEIKMPIVSNPSISYVFFHILNFEPKNVPKCNFFKHQNQLRPMSFLSHVGGANWPFVACLLFCSASFCFYVNDYQNH